MRGPAIALLAFCVVALAVTPPWPAIGHDSSRTRFTPNGPAVTKPWNTNTNYSFISSLGPAVDSNGVTYMVGAEGNGCSVVAFDPLTGATHDVLDCPEGTGLSFYTGLVITTNAAGDVLLFPMLAPNGWQMVAVTTGGKSLWSTQITGPIAPPVVSVDGSLVFVLTQSNNQGVVLALDTTTGALSWNTTVTRLGAANIQSSYQLLADNEGAIYVTVMRGHNYAYWNTTLARLSATSGALLWNISLIMGLPTPFVFAPSLSALVYSSEGALIAISTKTGKQLWSQQLPLTTCIGVLMHDPVNGNFYFTCQDSTLLAVNSTGGLLWTYVVKSAPGALGSPSMAVRSPANDTDAGAVVYNGQANLSNLSVPFTALTDTGSLMWSKLISVTYPTVYLVGPNVCVYYSAGTSLNPSVSVSCIPGSFSA